MGSLKEKCGRVKLKIGIHKNGNAFTHTPMSWVNVTDTPDFFERPVYTWTSDQVRSWMHAKTLKMPNHTMTWTGRELMHHYKKHMCCPKETAMFLGPTSAWRFSKEDAKTIYNKLWERKHDKELQDGKKEYDPNTTN